MMNPEILQALEDIPYLFTQRSMAGRAVEGIYAGKIATSTQELLKLETVARVLKSSEVADMVDSGRLALGMIKPHVGTALGLPSDDEQAARVLLTEIDKSKVVFNFAYKFTPGQAEVFYALIKEQYQDVMTPVGDSIWESLYAYAPSGPLSIILLYDESGNAVQWWRNRMGNTQPGKAAKDSIRGMHAVQEMLPNNLVHGSGSIEEAKREISLVSEMLSDTAAQLKNNAAVLPSDNLLEEIHFLPPSERFVFSERIYDSGVRSESCVYGTRVASLDQEGYLIDRYLKEYHVISLGGALTARAQELQRRYELLDANGVLQPRLYGIRGATLYRDYIANDGTSEVLEDLRRVNKLDYDQRRSLNQLVDIGAKLDRLGFKPLNFLGDVIFDADKRKFFLSDLGFDLGAPTDTPSTLSLNSLVSRFPRQSEYIRDQYSRH